MMKWFVLIKCDQSNFFKTAACGCFLSGIVKEYDGQLAPVFLPGDPVAYPLNSARFLVRELRRSGYNVSCRPWIFYKFTVLKLSRADDPWKK